MLQTFQIFGLVKFFFLIRIDSSRIEPSRLATISSHHFLRWVRPQMSKSFRGLPSGRGASGRTRSDGSDPGWSSGSRQMCPEEPKTGF